MPTALPEPLVLQDGAVQLAVYRWGEPGAARPAVLLTHGTGFCAAVWSGVAERLATDFVVYAIDRRGHGASSKPADAYEFLDFAGDAVRVIDGLQLHGAYALGHSAGATDLLLASVQRPDAFRSVYAMEPTAMNARAPTAIAEAQGTRDERLDASARKRASFASVDDAFEHYRTRGIFQTWQPELLRAYVEHALEPCADGTVTLRCSPAIERVMLSHIFRVMDGSYTGDARGNPFALFDRIRVPTCVATTEGSHLIFKHMAQAAQQCIPRASAHCFPGVGHTAAQTQPEIVALEARRFWSETAT